MEDLNLMERLAGGMSDERQTLGEGSEAARGVGKRRFWYFLAALMRHCWRSTKMLYRARTIPPATQTNKVTLISLRLKGAASWEIS